MTPCAQRSSRSSRGSSVIKPALQASKNDPHLPTSQAKATTTLVSAISLNVIHHQAPPRIEVGDDQTLDLYVREGSDRARRECVLLEWYRGQLKAQIPPIIAQWEPVLGVQVSAWGVKRMRTRWGSCNIKARRIWLNLELAKRPISSLEYVIVHEMVHFLERLHNDRFFGYMDRFMPGWRQVRDTLNAAPIEKDRG